MMLIVGTETSLAMDSYKEIIAELEKMGEKVVVFKQDRCLVDSGLHFSVTNGHCAFKVESDGRLFDLEEFDRVWYDHPLLPEELLRYEPVEHREFIQKQYKSLRDAFCATYANKMKWLNNPLNASRAENKILQLLAAAKVGLRLPETYIGNDQKTLKDLAYKRIIISKSLAVHPIMDHVIYTELVTPEQLANEAAVRYVPAIYQHNIPKAYELRITVVGDKLFTAKILSQADSGTALDWRAKPRVNNFEVEIQKSDLPHAIAVRVMRLMQALGLRYGAIDMIVTPEGEHVFLEINPTGQWYFVQLQTGLPIAKQIAHELLL